MEYSNPEIPEGINTSQSHPLKEFLWLTSSVMVTVIAIFAGLILLVDGVTAYIPFSAEKNIPFPEFAAGEKEGPLPEYLQSLADRIVEVESLPDEMKITVHYLDDETVNAFATLGGHVFFFRGLLEKLPNENSLTMLMAHEIAHIKHRHPIKSLGRGIVAGIALSVVSATAGDAIIESFLGEAGSLTILKYSREMESEADETAVKALKSIYGHLDGADKLFEVLKEQSGSIEPPEFFSTHPVTDGRIEKLNTYTKETATQNLNNITPLPAAFNTWIIESSLPDSEE